MRKLWMTIVIGAIVLGLAGCTKKETPAPAKEEVKEEIGEMEEMEPEEMEPEEMEETETPAEQETEELEGIEEEESGGYEEWE